MFNLMFITKSFTLVTVNNCILPYKGFENELKTSCDVKRIGFKERMVSG